MTALARPYAAADLPACLAIFDSNLPQFFAPAERAGFRDHLLSLAAAPQPYLVLEQGGEVLACGGLSVDAAGRRAQLCWGMVDRRHHGQGLGRLLTKARLAQARALPGIERVGLSTSQHTAGFYAGFGFAPVAVTPGGFGPGLDRWDMVLQLSPR